ncbi:MAG TPA: uroporphyrinogen-III synthase, partial [Acidimicrobiia bacterium]|nr:uroporphyrinogen-III synthase [Acidimicrobiia bacterium]
EIIPADDDVLGRARARAEEVDWLMITSPRTVATLWPEGGMPDVWVAVVGKRTAHAVESAGGVVDMVGDLGSGVLVERLLERVNGTVFFPHGAGSDPFTIARLQEMGVTSYECVVYETHPIPPRADPVDAAIFGSPSAVAGWSLSRSFDGVTVGAIGPTTADALVARGHPPEMVANHPSFEDLIDLAARHLSDRNLV